MENLLSDRIKSIPPSFIKGLLEAAADPDVISFAGGLPNPDTFPQQALLESTQRIIKTHGSSVFQYSLTQGLPQLREYIADRYSRKYGFGLTIDDIMIVTGSQQALDLIGRVLLNEGDGVVVENPTYLAALQAFSMNRPDYYPVDLTDSGLDIAQLSAALDKPRVKLLYAIPNFQNPTGLTYSAENREQVYEAIRGRDIVLVEDDPYGELRYDSEQLPYIGFGRFENSLVLGSFSKTVTPGLRTGFIICKNKTLLEQIAVAKEASDLHTNVFAQYLIWDYLTHNDYDAHIAKIKALYRKQAQAMMDAMDRYFPKGVKHTVPDGGMFLWVTLPEGVSSLAVFPKALEKRVAFVPGDPFYVDVKNANTMRVNYTNADEATIEEGIRRLGEVLKELLRT